MKNKGYLQFQLNSLEKLESDPTIIPCKMVVLDFEKSKKNIIVTEEVALDGAKTLKGKPIVAKYYENTSFWGENNSFGDHAVKKKIDKDGKEIEYRDTVAIGVFTSDGYKDTITDRNGVEKEALVADGQLWYTKYPEACDLLLDWNARDIPINMSSEYMFSNYSVVDDVTYHLSPIIFEAHTILGSEERGDKQVVNGAYESSTMQIALNSILEFDEAIATRVQKEVLNSLDEKDKKTQDEKENKNQLNQEDLEGNENKDSKEQSQLNAISHEEIRENLRDQIRAHNNESWIWVNYVYNDHVIVESEDENYKSVYYMYNYVIDESDKVVVDTASKKSVQKKVEWVEQNNALQEKYDVAVNKLVDANDTITQLNAQIEELNQYKTQVAENALNEKIETQMNTFKEKFEKFGLVEQFNSEEIQNLIKNSINDSPEGKEALLSLNSILVDNFDVESLKVSTKGQTQLNSSVNSYSRKNINKETPKTTEEYFEQIYGQ